jgi:hypothetical protein
VEQLALVAGLKPFVPNRNVFYHIPKVKKKRQVNTLLKVQLNINTYGNKGATSSFYL